MNLISILLTGSLIAGSLGANAFGMIEHQAEPEKTTPQTINQMKAIKIALDQTKGGLVTKSKIEDDNGLITYEIDILKQNEEYEVEINATNGEVIGFDQEIEGMDEDAPQGVSPTISLEDAKKAALEKVKGNITEAELEFEDNQLFYEIEVLTDDQHEVDVTVNADNGSIISNEDED